MSYVAASAVRTNRPLISRGEQMDFAPSADLLDRGRFAGDQGAGADGLSEGSSNQADNDIDLRQLRHHTKNTLQRILGLIADAPGLCDTPAGEKIARELEYRIALSADISNALFGLTGAPGSMAARLRQLAGAVVDMMRDPDQVIRVGVSVRGNCPAELREAVLRSAHELLGNSVKHGLKGRSSGRISARLVSNDDSTTLSIVDNGWGFSGKTRLGEGLALARGFAARHRGSLEIDGMDGTVCTLQLFHSPAAD